MLGILRHNYNEFSGKNVGVLTVKFGLTHSELSFVMSTEGGVVAGAYETLVYVYMHRRIHLNC